MTLDPDTCWDRLRARDPRFDGTFFVGVSSTGIYCRPVCPARTPARERCAFFHHAAAAEAAGYRACLRCRPERAPGAASVDARSRLVRKALARIEAGALDRGSVGALAASLVVGDRHLRRVFEAELGVSPHAWASTRRAALARQLLTTTSLPAETVAQAAGFGSARRMRAVVATGQGRGATAALAVNLDARGPFDGAAVAPWIASRGAAGVERSVGVGLRRVASVGGRAGVVEIQPTLRGVRVEVSVELGPALAQILPRARRMFDLDTDPHAVTDALGGDPLLAAGLARPDATRLPGAFDVFEYAVRAVVGQQVSVRAATTAYGRIADTFGAPVSTADPELRVAFPSAERLAALDVTALVACGLTGARAGTIVALARAVVDEQVDLGDGVDPEEVQGALLAVPGIGPWTASNVLMRGLGFPDAFPAADLGLRRALGDCTTREAEQRAEAWRPYRSYAAMILWRNG